ncbi:transketolase [Raineyella fluvialis]|uniref:Transketolase n=2 Tax=Raineyella fluvialis TaxID=2662261 RepID=A0A5Q2FE66_9ACTN|nr:transketolase [Raineyella fluvialis]
MAETLRASVMHMLAEARSGHSAGPLGMAEILASLYFGCMKHDPDDPAWEGRDVFMLSNGHTAPILYAALAHAGYFPVEELTSLRQFGSRLQGHPERVSLPGLESTSGPLGEGLSQAAGYAYVLKKLHRNPHRFVYVVMGDGELNEGNVWEAAMFAAKNGLGQLIGIVDRNYIQIDGATESVMPLGDLRAKWEAFGWHVLEVNGHSVTALLDAVQTAQAVVDRPTMILAHTIPGKGVDFMEYDFRWHGKPPSPAERDAWRSAQGLEPAGFDHVAAEKEQ